MLPIASISDLRQSPAWARYMESLGWRVEKVEGCRLYIKKLPFGLGSIIKVLRPSLPIPFEKIGQLAKKHSAWFVKLEPRTIADGSQTDFQEHGFYPSSWPLSPSKTTQIDLRKSKKELWSGFKKKTRNIIRRGEKCKVLIRQPKGIEQFYELWVKSMRRRGDLLTSGEEVKKIWEAFGENIYLLLAYQPSTKTQPLAGILMPVYGQIGYYFAAVSTKDGKKLGAPSLLVWQAILLAKKLGCRVFDFDGIYDPRYHRATKSWQGFTHFKKGFGGEEVDFVGSVVKGYGFLKRFQFLLSHF